MPKHWSPMMDEKLNSENASFEYRIDRLNEAIETHNNIMFFGGAGVSTESGIPDFRSKNGLYNQHDVQFDKYEPEYLLSKDCLFNNPKVFYEFYRQKLDCRNVKPNMAHYKLAEMESKNKLSCVITQNIDGLHQKAGSKNVLEIHGAANRVYCAKCGKQYPADYLFTNTDAIPNCECRGQIRPDITLYGENLPAAFIEAIKAIEKADMLIIAGTSLTVSPANTLVSYFTGDILVIINRDNTAYDNYADIRFNENISNVFSQVTL